MKIRNPFNWNLRFGTIPSEFKEAMTYEEQIQWLYYQIKELKDGTANYNYELLENKPSINGIVLQGNITKAQLGIDNNYLNTTNKPSINNVTLIGNKSLGDLGIQGKLIAGSGITISADNVISSTGGGGGGGTTNYELLENKPSINDIILNGNLTAHDLKLQDELSYLRTDYVTGKNIITNNVDENDVILPPYTEFFNNSAPDGCYIEIDIVPGTLVEFKGICDLVEINQANVIKGIYSTYGEYDHLHITSTINGKLFIGFSNISENEPEVKIVETGIGNWNIINNLQKEDKSIYHDLKDVVEANYSYKNYTSELIADNLYMPQNDNSVILNYKANAKTIKIDKKIFSMIYIKGKCLDYASIMYLNSNNKIIDSYPANQNFNQYLKLNIPDGTTSIIFNFTDTNEISPELWLIDIDKFKTFKTITGDPLVLNADGSITQGGNAYNLETGIYVLDTPIFYLSSSNIAFYNGEIIIYDSEEKIFNSIMKKVYYVNDMSTQEWVFSQNENITNEIVNSREMLPTSQAVYKILYTLDNLNDTDPITALDRFEENGIVYIKKFTDTTNSSEIDVNKLFYFDPYQNKWITYGNTSETFSSPVYQQNYSTDSIYFTGSQKWKLDDDTFSTKTLAGDINSSNTRNALVTDDQVVTYVEDKFTYSSSEKKIGTWINGKPLYECVITGTVPTTSTDGTYVTKDIDISNLSAKVIFVKSIFFTTNNDGTGESVQIPYLTNSGNFIKSVILSNRRALEIINGISAYSGRTAFIILNYTKTTD